MDSPGCRPPELLQVVHVPPFFQEHLGELQLHHRLPELRTSADEFVFQGITRSLLQPRLRSVEKGLPPRLDLGRRHLDLPTQLAQILPPKQSNDDLALPPGTPTLRQLSFRQHLVSVSLDPSVYPNRVSKKTG